MHTATDHLKRWIKKLLGVKWSLGGGHNCPYTTDSCQYLTHSSSFFPSKSLYGVIQCVVWRGHVLWGLTEYTSQPCLVSGSPFKANVRPAESLQEETWRFLATLPWLSALCHSLLLSFSLGWDSKKKKKFFFSLWKMLIVPCQSRYHCLVSKTWMPNSLGLWYTQMVFLFCISANAVTKYNNFSSKVIKAHLAPSLICPTCYLLITLWGDLVVLLLLRAKGPRG